MGCGARLHMQSFVKQEVTARQPLVPEGRAGMIMNELLSGWLHSTKQDNRGGLWCYPVIAPFPPYVCVQRSCPEQGVQLLGLLLTGSTGQHMAGRNGLA
jgi:hypothetical protein